MPNPFLSLLKIIIFTVLLFLLSSYIPPVVYADSIVFEDNFEDNSIGLKWNIKNYDIKDNGSFGNEHPLSISEHDGYIEIYGSGNNDIDWYGRSLITSNSFNFLDKIEIISDVNIPEQTNGSAINVTIEFDQNNRIVCTLGQIINNNIKAAHLAFEENSALRINNDEKYFNYNNETSLIIRLTYNPDTKEVVYLINNELIDSGIFHGSTINNPHVGIAAIVRDKSSSIDARFDNFKVISNAPINNNLNVPDLKQYSEPWWDDEYDSASIWSPTPISTFIKRWGCALTSASMILDYYGSSVKPDILNNWLKGNKGYNSWGGILWPAISKYSEIDSGTPTLEFTYLNYSEELLRSEIDTGRPPILKLFNQTFGGNHFIVAKGYDDANIYISDPGNGTNTTLSQANAFWGNPIKIGRFMPSETDLSYIVLFVDNGFNIKVSSSSGEIVGNEYYFKEYPMSDPDNPNSEGNLGPINAFYYPRPDSGLYDIQIIGNGDYKIEFFIYDKDGKVQTDILDGSINNNEQNKFLINFNKDNSDDSGFRHVTFKNLLDYWKNLNQQGEIKNKGFYTSVTNLIENALKNMDKGKRKASKALLNIVLQKVRYFTPRFINNNDSVYFQKQIEIILSGL